MSLRRVGPLLAVFAVAALVAVPAAGQSSPTPSAGATSSGSSIHVAAVGDIMCSRGHRESPNRLKEWGDCGGDRVGKLVTDGNYDAFLGLGDLQYLHGAYNKFVRYYGRAFGSVKKITYPAPGNHEGYTKDFRGYFQYFGRMQAHAPGGYYSFDLGVWYLI